MVITDLCPSPRWKLRIRPEVISDCCTSTWSLPDNTNLIRKINFIDRRCMNTGIYFNGFNQTLWLSSRVTMDLFSKMEETLQSNNSRTSAQSSGSMWHVGLPPIARISLRYIFRAVHKPPDFNSKQCSGIAGMEALGWRWPCTNVKPKSTVHLYKLVCILLWTITSKILHILFISTFFLNKQTPPPPWLDRFHRSAGWPLNSTWRSKCRDHILEDPASRKRILEILGGKQDYRNQNSVGQIGASGITSDTSSREDTTQKNHVSNALGCCIY